MEEAQRRFEVVDGRVAGDDDRHPPLLRLLERRQDQRARLLRRAGDVEARVWGGDALEGPCPRDLGADGGNELVGHPASS